MPPLLPRPSPPDYDLIVFIQREKLSFTLPRTGRLSIGRSHDNDIRVDHTSVSRCHLLLHISDKLFEIEDLNSSNGTFFVSEQQDPRGDEATNTRGRQLGSGERAELSVGEIVRVGSVLITVQRKSPSTMHEALRPMDKHSGAIIVDPEVQRVHELGARAAQTNITVLILGETGVGKEVLAETIHRHSKRAKRPLLRLNCAALSESLLEGELFGHERGAFTGAVGAKAGLLEANDRGTVFLDEIGELPLSTQAKLLRVLEEGAVRRLGSTTPRRIDVRFITATNRQLQVEVARGRFREDLYFRINKVTLTLPPLRERVAEIEPLARFFLHEFCKSSGIPEPTISGEALEALRRYRWPGNVRELRNAMERAPFLSTDGELRAEHLPRESDNTVPDFPEVMFDADVSDSPTGLHDVSPVSHRKEAGSEGGRIVDANAPRSDRGGAGFGSEQSGIVTPRGRQGRVAESSRPPSSAPKSERERVVRALEACGGNQTRAAKFLGISRRTLINRLDEFGLPRPKKRARGG